MTLSLLQPTRTESLSENNDSSHDTRRPIKFDVTIHLSNIGERMRMNITWYTPTQTSYLQVIFSRSRFHLQKLQVIFSRSGFHLQKLMIFKLDSTQIDSSPEIIGKMYSCPVFTTNMKLKYLTDIELLWNLKKMMLYLLPSGYIAVTMIRGHSNLLQGYATSHNHLKT